MEKTFTFEFTEKEANIVLNSLAEMPFKAVSDLIQKIITTANKQQVEKVEAEPV